MFYFVWKPIYLGYGKVWKDSQVLYEVTELTDLSPEVYSQALVEVIITY